MTNDKLNDELGRLAALGRCDVLDTSPEAAFDTIVHLVRKTLDVPMSAVSFIDSDRQWFKSRAGLDVTETAREVAFCDFTIRQTDPLIVSDAAQDSRFRDNPLVTGGPNIGSYVGVPLRTADGYNIGSLCAIDTQARTYDPIQIEVLEHLAKLVVEHLELRNLAERDSLTGALTRRAFMAELDKQISLYARQRRPAALVMIDIDHFKQINDQYGHPAGDKAIKALTDLCEIQKRPSDLIGRLGGEEFGLLLPETGEAHAVEVAQRLRLALSQLAIPDNPDIKMTASFGVAAVIGYGSNREAWVSAADAALYKAKRTGRDRVCNAPGPLSNAA